MEYILKQEVLDAIHRISCADTDILRALARSAIVKCGECRKRGKKECPLLMINSHNIDVPEDDDFCSWGEI